MKGSNILWFIGGAVIGSLVTWKLVEGKYKKIADEEIASVKKAYENKKANEKDICDNRQTKVEETKEEVKEEKKPTPAVALAHSNMNKPDILEYRDKVTEYTTPPFVPYRIEEDQYGDCDYETLSMTYYSDGVLADDGDFVVDDVDKVVGIDNLEDLANDKEDIIWIRNDERRCDYEIAFSQLKYSEITKY